MVSPKVINVQEESGKSISCPLTLLFSVCRIYVDIYKRTEKMIRIFKHLKIVKFFHIYILQMIFFLCRCLCVKKRMPK